MQYSFPTSRTTYIFRGLTHACPRCGCRKTHTKYFSIKPSCPTCGLKFEKEQGYWTGALAINFLLTGAFVITGIVIGLISTAPDIAVIPIISILMPLSIVLPVIFYPFSHTVWMAIDYGFMSRLDS